ncbi:MAG TPA: hypothetical protein VLB49_16830 [Gemmatimonadales bacterium]|nr:hypothetical protein [Gemmatimonadales bacterium]
MRRKASSSADRRRVEMNGVSSLSVSALGLLFVMQFGWIVSVVQADADTWPSGTPMTVSPRRTTSLTFGTAVEAVRVVQAVDFDPFDYATSAANLSFFTNGVLRFDPGSFMAAAFQLPSGALLTRYEVEACDDDGAAEVRFEMFRSTSPGGGAVTVGGLQSTGVPDTPGCAFFPGNIGPAIPVNNQTSYFNIFMSAPTVNARIAAVACSISSR